MVNKENFLLRNNRYKVWQTLSNYHVVLNQAVMHSTHGRPKNGMFIAIQLELKEQAIDVSPDHWRLQAVIIETNSRL